MDNKERKRVSFSVVYLIVALLGAWLFQELIFEPAMIRQREVSYSEFLQQLEAGKIEQVTLGQERIMYSCCPAEGEEDDLRFHNVVRVDDPDLIERLNEAGVEFSAEPPPGNLLTNIFGYLIFLLPVAAIWFFVFRRMGQGASRVMSIGKSGAREIEGEMTGMGFEDVGGLEEVEVELKEIIAFLKNPERFTQMGAKLPKGVLLVGPPGTGKTLLAQATAGEAGVPFFSISGSDFVQMFVGVGAARVRDLFEQAKRRAPCIIFIDEIDAVGQSRASVGALGTNDEREQTLNQLLHEMDGFEPNQGVVIMAATNRPEVLDPALLRPGRFDRQVQVPLPTETGRLEILKIHTEEVPLAPDADLARLARVTAGFSGADLANIVNEAALLAVRRDHERVRMDDFELAIERVVAGLQRRNTLSDEVKEKVAYHEGGHALVAYLQPDTEPVHKVSIIPTSKGALGYTLQMPEEDAYLLTKTQLEERLTVMLGGRAAELLVYAEPTTGAANDLERASQLARRMVTEFGMTEELGPVRYSEEPSITYLRRTGGLRQELSPETTSLIDREVRRIVEEAEVRAKELLTEHLDDLHEVARRLVEKEVISGEEIAGIAGEVG
ncbi:MAG: ATP-dependent zinc metalloprotease FtsH [Anaerolineales bacterium]